MAFSSLKNEMRLWLLFPFLGTHCQRYSLRPLKSPFHFYKISLVNVSFLHPVKANENDYFIK